MKPSKQEYERAIIGNDNLRECIKDDRKYIDKYLDMIIHLKTKIKDYEKTIEHNNETIMLYNLYEERDKIVKADGIYEN